MPAIPKSRASHAQPEVASGSMLDVMATLNPSRLADYVKAVLDDIDRCAAGCAIAGLGMDQAEMLDQIHTLKNALVPLGSQELLKACERLRSDTCRGVNHVLIERRYQAVAHAAVRLVRTLGDTIPKSTEGLTADGRQR